MALGYSGLAWIGLEAGLLLSDTFGTCGIGLLALTSEQPSWSESQWNPRRVLDVLSDRLRACTQLR